MSDFYKAYRGDGRDVVYETLSGTQIIKRQWSVAWRNNNPGNIERGEFSRRNGAIGDDGRFAIFPNYNTGRNALENLLKTKSYQSLRVKDAMNRYAPDHENDTEAYIKFIEKNASISRDMYMKDLSSSGVSVFADAIERFEGNIEGKTLPFPKRKPVFDATGRMIRD